MKTPCDKCTALCCRYIVLELPRPRQQKDLEELRWIVLHKNCNLIITHDQEWLAEFETECEWLQDNRCQNHAERPTICQNYGEGTEGNEVCSYFKQQPHNYSQKIKSLEQLEKYLQETVVIEEPATLKKYKIIFHQKTKVGVFETVHQTFDQKELAEKSLKKLQHWTNRLKGQHYSLKVS